jgi:GAF domain-containing protein
MNRTVVSFNIERFRKLLESEPDGEKRRTILNLLAEEQNKIASLEGPASGDRQCLTRQCAKCGGQLRVLTQSSRFRPPHDHVLTTYFECSRCVHIQIDDRVTPAQDHLDEILRLAMAEVGASKGNIQLLDRPSQTLFIAVHHGFDIPFLDYFRTVSASDKCACGIALREQKRIIVEDVDGDDDWKDMLSVARDAGFRAVQSTPLIGRDGQVAGMLSTHFDGVHRPSDDDFKRMARHVERAFDLVD